MSRQPARRSVPSQAIAATAAVLALSFGLADAGRAACTRLAFSVNDYGKVGPTNDAKRLLDTYIAKWTADRRIKGYTVGPKEVTCELFLDVGLFDEYTCKAAATVCWNGPLPPGHKAEGAAGAAPIEQPAAPRARPAPKAADAAAPRGEAAISTGSVRSEPDISPGPKNSASGVAAPGGPAPAARSVIPSGAPAARAITPPPSAPPAN